MIERLLAHFGFYKITIEKSTGIRDHLRRLIAEIEKEATDQIYFTGFTTKPKPDTTEHQEFWDSVDRIAKGQESRPWKKGWVC